MRCRLLVAVVVVQKKRTKSSDRHVSISVVQLHCLIFVIGSRTISIFVFTSNSIEKKIIVIIRHAHLNTSIESSSVLILTGCFECHCSDLIGIAILLLTWLLLLLLLKKKTTNEWLLRSHDTQQH
jgi:hypothetical protein